MRAVNEQFALTSLLPAGRFGGLAAKLLSIDKMQRAYESARTIGNGHNFPERLLDSMKVRYSAAPADLKQIPVKGAAVVVANHPFGLLEAAVLVSALRQIRQDVRVLTNDILEQIPELHEFMIPVDVLSGDKRVNIAGMRRAIEFLAKGGLLLVFPAGAVSHFQWKERTSMDPEWSPTVARLINCAVKRGSSPTVVPVYVPGTNSFLFHAAGMAHKGLRTILLAREFVNKSQATVELRIGRPIASSRLLALHSNEDRIRYLRWRTYLLADRLYLKQKPIGVLAGGTPDRKRSEVVAPVPAAGLVEEIERLPREALLTAAGDLEVYLSPAPSMPNVLREIGRLRELTFRAVGEGTGSALDLDRFDWYYLHLFVWNAKRQEIVGAYRLQGSDVSQDLYTRTLFHYGERFLEKLGPALELGRSFVRQEYQKGFAPLLLLWKGIGKFVSRHPRYRVLFGPVSISNQYPTVSKELMIAFMENQVTQKEWSELVRARNAPRRPRSGLYTHVSDYCMDIDELSEIVSDLDPSHGGVPVLLRQYLRLGGRLLGFSVDSRFSDAVDGLIVVDLMRTEFKLLERYLGKEEAAAFREKNVGAAAVNSCESDGCK